MDAALAQAWSQHQSGDVPGAERAYRALLDARPQDADLLNCFGILLMQTGREFEAFDAFSSAVSIDPAQVALKVNLARAALRLAQPEIALQACDSALSANPDAINAWLMRGVALRDLDRLDDACSNFREALVRHPGHFALHYNLAASELAAGHVESAEQETDLIAAQRPRDARVWLAVGNVRAARGQLDAAVTAYRQALSLDPALPEASRLLGITELQRNQTSAAITCLQRALQADARDQSALAALSVAGVRGESPLAGVLLDFGRLVMGGPLRHVDDAEPDSALQAPDARLVDEILAQPSLRFDRSQKTTRDGGQTGNLAGATTPALSAFLRDLRNTLPLRVRQMSDAMRALSHPLAGTAPTRWQLNLWATVLQQQGRQEPHLHPSGWLSGVYYVALPSVRDGCNDGWLELGRPPTALDPAWTGPVREWQPRLGELVTFPSYLYHRTLPHVGTQPRISLAFDLVPLD